MSLSSSSSLLYDTGSHQLSTASRRRRGETRIYPRGEDRIGEARPGEGRIGEDRRKTKRG